jgi:4-hydroxyphenylpyruvate dioxygenase
MPDLFDNPLGLDGFEFIEFCAPERGMLEPVFEGMGFTLVARHRAKDVQLWRQGGINLIANYEPRSPAAYFAAEHGPSACGMGWRVRDAAKAYAAAIERGAEPVEVRTGPMELHLPAFRGIGGSIIYLIDRYEGAARGDLSIYDIDFVYEPGVDRHPAGTGLKLIDHLTHNVYGGRMAHWASFYERVAGFREIRYFDIEGRLTGLKSKAMTSPCGKIRIPINESSDDQSQIAEYLDAYHGEGIQHIALATDGIYAAVDALRPRGIEFQDTPDAYYDGVDARVAGHRERRTASLYAMSRELAIGMETQYIAEVAVRHLAAVFDARVVVLLPDLDDKVHYPASQQPLRESLRKADLGVAQWVYDNEKPAGFGTQTLPGAEAHYLPPKASLRTRGVLAIKAAEARRILAPEQYRLLETFATQIAITLERVHFAEVAQSTELTMQGERLRNHLLSAISHDLRTPLAGIVGATSALLTQPQMEADSKRALLEGLHEEALHMSSLVHNLLDMARLEAGAVTIKREWQPLEEVIGSTLNLMGRRLEQHPVRLDLPPELPWVQIDSVLMERVLVNLLDNAVKYTPPGGAISLDLKRRGAMAEIVVADSGPGIPEVDCERVMERFVRLDSTRSTPGNGLGLSMVRAVARLHDAQLSLSSNEPGLKVCLSFPIP